MFTPIKIQNILIYFQKNKIKRITFKVILKTMSITDLITYKNISNIKLSYQV